MSPGSSRQPCACCERVRPDAGEAVGLQLDAHAQRVGLRLAAARPRIASTLPRDAHQVLHVVADLVRDHVGLRELAGRAEAGSSACRRSRGRCRPSGRPGSRTGPSPPGPVPQAVGVAPRKSTQLGRLVGACRPARKTSVQTTSVSAQHRARRTRASRSSAGGAGAGPAAAAPAAPPPPLSMPSMVSGLMPKIQPATSATTMRADADAAPADAEAAAAAASCRARLRRCCFLPGRPFASQSPRQ